ncbi:hypothetical protein [Serratia odorifera]|uniref:Uncharacterized protein n=2 Tax=Serratia odorifera TaxID=618 RepID=D4DVQ8_SEROD|nr:hypothetical protein [Serratia odorifera]EFE98351.1 hypothetical protein HMPREF0758_0008 [Serratia odorifera DSM 4582]PNK89321.1 hypothetical protein CEQ31_006210 [Serratia odorifera]RII70433.1 hypothetical protein DX901_20090 [Serratia odorifera]VDZ63640.1 Uncharacterised protein [Serratia odorifera]
MRVNQQSNLVKNILFSLATVFIISLSIIFAALSARLLFSGLLWAFRGEFDMTWKDVIKVFKMGLYAGVTLGGAVILFRLFKVKGF